MQLKIGRHTYTITEEDMFMDNGECIQLLTQSKEEPEWGRRPSPVLSKKLSKEISKLPKKFHKHTWGDGVFIFSIDNLN